MTPRAAAVLAALGVLLLSPAPVALAAPAPGAWCGPGETGEDLPDASVGKQVHVVYARPADAPDRFAERVTPIVRDLARIDDWWLGQDPTRMIRFDMAAFDGCDSLFGRLDVSSLGLPGATADYAGLDPGRLLGRLRGELAATFADAGKKYLVYFDGPSASGNVCGISNSGPPTSGTPGLSSLVFVQSPVAGCVAGGGLGGGGWQAVTAVHELLHAFQPGTQATPMPHGCDGNHVCDDPNDVMRSSGIGSPQLSAKLLDAGRDDYYGHGNPGLYDVRDSPFLVRVGAPAASLAMVVPTTGGRVSGDLPGIRCADDCMVAVDAGTNVVLSALAEPGYSFAGWSGACVGMTSTCSLAVDGDREVSANFGRPTTVRVRVAGAGTVDGCSRACLRTAVEHQLVTFAASAKRHAKFVRWGGACQGRRVTCTMVVGEGRIVRAEFAAR